MKNNNAQLLAALKRLVKAYETDAMRTPNMSVLVSWETNGQAIAQATKAIDDAEGVYDTGPEACAMDAMRESHEAVRQNAAAAIQ